MLKILFDFQVIIVKNLNCVNGDGDTEPAHANVPNSNPLPLAVDLTA